MWTVPSRVVVAADGFSSSSSSSPNSFFKDGRKINIGDCALFKPPQDSPPFIGIIRWVTTGKENKLKLGVNWLYRRAEVKLGKGILLDAAPNEIFYSFHKDEISAASLLHPCKVAFLPKGAELPPGISSFVCRRLYDITNKCLWWLTDKDYIDERQEEVDQLLYKTRVEMHATAQSGGRSPKPSNGPTSTSQLKAGTESIQNSISSLSSQVKKKRERGEQGTEPVKRERIMKTDDGDSGHCRHENLLKSEITKITEKGALVDLEGVERFVQLMLPDRGEKKIDLAGRSMLAGVIAATDKVDCLSQFVQLRGLPVFDEWLQEVHKGKIGDISASKDSDKSIEEFLLVLLRALDKLPVNLQALQTCNIGKSVNHLRSHKNSEIQKKARGLVDTWKKRVEAEMNINDVKSGSNQVVSWRTRPEVGNRQSGGSSDYVFKNAITQLQVAKLASAKPVYGESTTRSASASPGSMKSVPSPASASTNLKDGHPRNAGTGGSMSDVPLTTARDEKSSSSSQSHNNSQSYSNDHARTGVSGKDEARSSSAGSMNVNKASGGSSRPRKSVNGFQGSVSGSQRDGWTSRNSSLHKNVAAEKSSHSGLTSERVVDAATVEGSSHKLIVKIPNRGRSPAQNSGGSFEDPSIMSSRASSPVLPEKHDQFDRSLKEKSDAYRATVVSDINAESWQSNDFKDVLTASDEGDGSPATMTDEERGRTGDENKKAVEVAKTASSSSGNEHKSGNLQEASFSSMHALIESCVKYSEGNLSMSAADDLGMNLLASVAAGEILKSDLVSPTVSPQRNTPVETGIDSKVKKLPADDLCRNKSKSGDFAGDERGKHACDSGNVGAKDEDNKSLIHSEGKPMSEHTEHIESSSADFQQAEGSKESNGKINDIILAPVLASPSTTGKKTEGANGEGGQPNLEKLAVDGGNTDGSLDVKYSKNDSLAHERKVSDGGSNKELKMASVEVSSSRPALEIGSEIKRCRNEGMDGNLHTDEKPPVSVVISESAKETSEEVSLSGSGKDLVSEKVLDMKMEKPDTVDTKPENQRTATDFNAPTTPENRGAAGIGSVVAHQSSEGVDGKKIEQFGKPVSLELSSANEVQEAEQPVRSRASKLTGLETDEAEECLSTTADASSILAVGGLDADAKVEFDLNEGFNADEGKSAEPKNPAPGCSPAGCLISPVPLPVSSVSSGLPASITVAAAAKGPFLPPDDLLRSKGELGWKGSAATSAFRPAEPRKVLDMPLGATNILHPDSTAGMRGRPPLDIDLNVPDERVLEDMASRYSGGPETSSASDPVNSHDLACNQSTSLAPVRSSGGLDLDLNQVDENSDMGNFSVTKDNPIVQFKSSSRGALSSEIGVRRDFDLNDGPAVEEVSAEPVLFSKQAKSSVPSQPPISGLRMSYTEAGNFSTLFHPGTTYPAVTIPTIIPDRGEQPFPIVTAGGPQRMVVPPSGGSSIASDVCRGSVLSASPAVPFSTSFQYPVFPYGTSFSLPTATFPGVSTTYLDSSSGGRLCFAPPAVHPQLLGPAGVVSSKYPRPCVSSLPDAGNYSNTESSRKWGRQGLDLNAGPGGPEIEGRDESSSLAAKPLSVSGSQTLADEQLRMFQIPGGTLKRKEPEGGWDGYKQSTWH